MKPPKATYRLQLNASFTFKDVENILSYLHQLGISTIYASPFFAATPGSVHGYDVCDPQQLNPEIGNLQQLQQIHKQLQQYNMSWLQDIVPNHMAFATMNNRLMDVMKKGPASMYYNWFDIDWQHPDPLLHGKLMTPVLGKPLTEALKDGEISLDSNNDGFVIKYFNQAFPVSVNAIPEKNINQINSNKQLLYDLLQKQYYQLCFWRDTNHVIDYRRFFAVNELISVNMTYEPVFNGYHSFVYNLYQQKLINGLRIDHIDGLSDPAVYLDRLRHLFGDECYIVVEKILEQNENLPPNWPIQGTTGYEFCSQINWLLTGKEGARKLVAFYKELFPETHSYQEIVFEKKQFFLQHFMAGEWENLVRHLYDQQLVPLGINRDELKQALGLVMCCLPVYRLYPGEQPLDADAQQIIKATFEDALRRRPELRQSISFLQSFWTSASLSSLAAPLTSLSPSIALRTFLQRLMQFTGPLMAKGVEDTTFYVYNPLLAHNEVGDTPDVTGYSVNTFHEWMTRRQEQYPYSLNATSTHDTKRGEDGRIRLLVLSWFTNDWKNYVQHWTELNAKYITTLNSQRAPALHDEYFIYQSVLSGFPADAQVTEEYINRLKEYIIKALREAKINSGWHDPATDYENACCDFIEKILSAQHHFIKSFGAFFEVIQQYANILSLTQTLIKITAPGVPDIYQGCELWDLSYVDPDNRRPVDYSIRKQYLQQIIELEKKDPVALLTHIANKRNEGLEKLYVTWKSLQCRNRFTEVFMHGRYIPIYATGNDFDIVAYARQYEHQWIIVTAPVSDALILCKEKEILAGICLQIPEGAPANWKNEFTGENFTIENNLPLDAVFNAFPVALLTGEN
jgi:(1->4)-alpha-D-glucan 1-alpha-D-glucosylmutase